MTRHGLLDDELERFYISIHLDREWYFRVPLDKILNIPFCGRIFNEISVSHDYSSISRVNAWLNNNNGKVTWKRVKLARSGQTHRIRNTRLSRSSGHSHNDLSLAWTPNKILLFCFAYDEVVSNNGMVGPCLLKNDIWWAFWTHSSLKKRFGQCCTFWLSAGFLAVTTMKRRGRPSSIGRVKIVYDVSSVADSLAW